MGLFITHQAMANNWTVMHLYTNTVLSICKCQMMAAANFYISLVDMKMKQYCVSLHFHFHLSYLYWDTQLAKGYFSRGPV